MLSSCVPGKAGEAFRIFPTYIVPYMPGSLVLAEFSDCNAANFADWIESLVRTMSSGYVQTTDVIPAAAPQNRRAIEPVPPPCLSVNCIGLSVRVVFSIVFKFSKVQ